MAYINVFDWKCEQVSEWLKGIEIMNPKYLSAFSNNFINGSKLLNIRPYELHELGIKKIGHQEIILEAIGHLKNFHFSLDRENLQFLALQVATISTSLNRKLFRNSEQNVVSVVSVDVLTDVAVAVSKVKVLIGWLDRYPFQGHTQYNEIRTQMLRLALELATIAQRDRFVHNPVKQIYELTKKLSNLADYIIQDITDPMLLQPSFLDLLTLKKKESELGFYIMPSYQFIHRVTDVKYNSPAHNSGKVEDGDEIVQINYQTVVGWQYKKVILLLQDLSTTDVILTLKKRPKHTKIYGQLMGLIKLPSKKRSLPYRFDNLPSPRVELINVPDLLIPAVTKPHSIKKNEEIEETDDSSGNESDLLTPQIQSVDKEHRLYLPKPRAVLQRRHTICGDDLVNFKHIGNLVLWHERKIYKENLESPSLRDKSISASFGFGLEMTRPTTCIGIGDKLNDNPFDSLLSKHRKFTETKSDIIQEQESENDDDCEHDDQIIKSGVSKVVRFDSQKQHEYSQDSKYTCNVEGTILESLTPIPYVDEEESDGKKLECEECVESGAIEMKVTKPEIKKKPTYLSDTSNLLVEAINEIVISRESVKRGRLDKSYSTPAYESESTPQTLVIDRKPFKIDVPPRQQVLSPPQVPPRKYPLAIQQAENKEETLSKMANILDLSKSKISSSSESPNATSQKQEIKNYVSKNNSIAGASEAKLELVTSTKIKTLTNKKKNSLIAKRRKITLKSLGTSATIQGHLYRRAKDKTEVAYWIKLYFVLIETSLYGFKTKDSTKADCVIFLNGFTVSLAKEVHSKPNSFKVYHPKKTFYMAAETNEAMNQWIQYIRQATTMKGTPNLDCDARELFSETECSDDEDLNVQIVKNTSLSSPLPVQEKGDKIIDQTPPPKHYHLNFGSLKKTFARGTSGSSNDGNSNSPHDHNNKFLGFFTTSKNEKKNNDIIVPTAQFKTYRKVKENSGGLQLGATSMINSNISDMYLSSNTSDNTSFLTGITSDSPREKDTSIELVQAPVSKTISSIEEKSSVNKSSNSLRKAHYFLHASNPNLLDFHDFHQTFSDFPSNHSASNSTWDHQITGQITLLDLMQQQLAEEMKDMYNKRVDQGFEKIEEKPSSSKTVLEKKNTFPEPKNVDPHIEKIQKRSLPITPDYAQSFKPEDRAIMYARSKEGLKLRDFGYELISNDDDNKHSTNKATNLNVNLLPAITDIKKDTEGSKIWSKRKIVPLSGSTKKKAGFNWMNSHDKEEAQTSCLGTSSSGSFRRVKKLDETRKSNNPIVIWNQDQSSTSKIPYFAKLPFSSTNIKEKKLLGSPKLHRAIFGTSDNEIFSPITFPKHSSGSQASQTNDLTSSKSTNVEVNYQHLQKSLPPTFKPETYSLNFLKND